MFAPCEVCKPQIHKYNLPVIQLYEVCGDQVILGFEGPVALDDKAILHSMKEYFNIKRKYRLELSRKLRYFYKELLAASKDK